MLQSVDQMGFEPTGRCLQLNSYENRVVEIELENSDPIVVKFYRPGRWSKATIQDEHDFLTELAKEGIPVVQPMKYNGEDSIYESQGIYITAFPKSFGRLPDEFIKDDLKKIGRRLAQIHNVGARKQATHRLTLNTDQFGDQSIRALEDWIAAGVRNRYLDAVEVLLDRVDDALSGIEFIRIHGDCHRGNLLNNGEEFFFVDFDDFVNGPVAQDFWILLSGAEQSEKDLFYEGYSDLREIPQSVEDLFEPLRGLRLLNYSAWIAKRWVDPSFPKLFPQFESYNYWAEETEALEKIIR